MRPPAVAQSRAVAVAPAPRGFPVVACPKSIARDIRCLLLTHISIIRQALRSSAKYEYFVFLQGSDYPLRSGTYIQRFLEGNRGCKFISLVKMPAPGYPLSKINKLRYPSDKPDRRFFFEGTRKARVGST